MSKIPIGITKIYLFMIFAVGSTSWLEAQESETKEQYTADWASLARHDRAPEWFQDAKIGIYFHWGVYSVPAYGNEHYPQNMYSKDSLEHKHHIKTYGDPKNFGYHDFVPLFKAEYFDADKWITLFEKAGAKFAGLVAEHNDGFSMWGSQINPWNTIEKGPRRDILGEIAIAVRKQKMKFIVTFHHARNNLRYSKQGRWEGYYLNVKENYAPLLEDPDNAILYGYMPREKFLQMWRDKLVEVIDHYQPDILWLDSWLHEIPKKIRQQLCAYYLNQADQWDKKTVICHRQDDLPLNFSIEDLNQIKAKTLYDDVWMRDYGLCTGSWSYSNNLTIKPIRDVVHAMIDIISKNGILLLNVAPKADGTIPEDQRKTLLELGDWLQINGEAIYATRPWKIYGQEPARESTSRFNDPAEFQYSDLDIRFTRSKDSRTLYVICLNWPEKPFTMNAVIKNVPSRAKVELIGSREKVSYEINENNTLTITPPVLNNESRPCKYAYVFKLIDFDLEAFIPVASGLDEIFLSPGQFVLKAEHAILSSERPIRERRAGHINIGEWHNASDSISWKLTIDQSGTYLVDGVFSAADGAVNLQLYIDNKRIPFVVPQAMDWDSPSKVEIGKITLKKPGTYELILSTANPFAHKAVNVWQINFVKSNNL